MNCQDITRVIDCGRYDALTRESLQEAEDHASSCGKCAPLWLAHRHLGALAIPQVPLDLSTRCLALADAGELPCRPGRSRKVTIVAGCVIALAAAAAMLVKSILDAPFTQAGEGAEVALSGETAVLPPAEGSADTIQPAAPAAGPQAAATMQGDIPLFPPQYAAEVAFDSRREMALAKLVELHPEVAQPLQDGVVYEAAILLREDGKVLTHSVRAIAPEAMHWSRPDSGWGGLPDDGGEGFGDFAPKGTSVAEGRTLGADLFFEHLLVRNDYDPGRSDRRVDEIIRTQRAELMLPVTDTGGRHVTVLLSPAGAIEREVPGFMNRDAMQEQEGWSATRRAEVMAGILGVSKDEIGLMGSVPVFDEDTKRAVFVDYAWRRAPGESVARYQQIGWDQYTPQGVDVATALEVVERVMPDAFNQEVEIALGIPTIILTEEGRFIRTARIRSSDPREDLPGITFATFRMLVLKRDDGEKAAVYFMWQGTPSDAPPGSPR